MIGAHPIHRRRRVLLLAAFPLVAVACGSGTPDAATDVSTTRDAVEADGNGATSGSGRLDRIEPSPPNVTVSGLAIYRGDDVGGAPEPLVDLDEIRSGGPPPDGIPSIDDPKFIDVGAVDFLEENEPVLAVDIDGDVRAYPVQILMWHEIVNDTVGGVPVAVTYCPLCNSAVAYDRRVDGQVLEFGTSGLLWNSALVMYDRQTETLWSHFTGEGIVGELTGTEIDIFPVATVPWGAWRDAHPDGLVLSRDTGFDRAYGRNPYPGYDDVTSQPFLFEGEVDGRYTAMTRIVGIENDGDAVGVPLDHAPGRRGGRRRARRHRPRVLLAGRDRLRARRQRCRRRCRRRSDRRVRPEIDGRPLTFSATDDGFADTETGSTWNLFGEAVSGELAGAQLRAVPHVDTFWFAWAAFLPDTEIVEG
jgi:hypothetical protein